MKIAYGSDLHFEFGVAKPPLSGLTGVDLLVLAGDIAAGRNSAAGAPLFLDYAKECSDELGVPVVTVMGNHEYYGEELYSFLSECRDRAESLDGVYLLENDVFEFAGVRFLGCTLWSDFEAVDDPLMARIEAQMKISDYHVIKVKCDGKRGRDCLSPLDTIEMNKTSRAFLECELAKPFEGPSVVVTHFPPIFMSDPKFSGGLLSAYFCNGWEQEMVEGQLAPDLWIAGHTHFSVDQEVGRTRLVSRQGGYPGELAAFTWKPLEL